MSSSLIQLKPIEITHICLLLFSVCFGTFIIFFACYQKLYQQYLSKFMLMIVIYEIIYLLSRLILLIINTALTQLIQSCLILCANLGRNTIIFFITFKYFDIIKNQSSVFKKKKCTLIIMIIIYAFPLLTSVIIVLLEYFYFGLNCNDPFICLKSGEMAILMYIFLYGVIILSLCLSGITCHFLLQQTKRLYNDYGNDSEQLCSVYKIFAWKIWIYPLTCAFALLLMSFNDILKLIFDIKLDILGLKEISLILKGLSGVVYSVLFIICDQQYLAEVKALFDNCCNKSKEEEVVSAFIEESDI